jgi:mRNA-degrading endonuclease toxin of MazEF toxin-antitoxin module
LGREVKRSEVWTVAGGKDYAGKPRPVVILQDDRFDMTDSITVRAFTTDPTDAPLFRLPIEPNESRLMVDKITTIPKSCCKSWFLAVACGGRRSPCALRETSNAGERVKPRIETENLVNSILFHH